MEELLLEEGDASEKKHRHGTSATGFYLLGTSLRIKCTSSLCCLEFLSEAAWVGTITGMLDSACWPPLHH